MLGVSGTVSVRVMCVTYTVTFQMDEGYGVSRGVCVRVKCLISTVTLESDKG